jgi:magnesium-protoporphyrin O-methyltransferase
MACSHCLGIENVFDHNLAEKDLKRYRQHGPSKTTRILINAIREANIESLTLLDIGGGVGVIRHELLNAGVSSAISVEGSSAFLEATKQEGERQGRMDQSGYLHGDFVDLAKAIPTADIVTLDKVICCYPDMQQLVQLSAERAGKIYAVVYPVDAWWMKVGVKLHNLIRKWQRNPFRAYVHSTRKIESLIEKSGLKLHFTKKSIPWHIAVYCRQSS